MHDHFTPLPVYMRATATPTPKQIAGCAQCVSYAYGLMHSILCSEPAGSSQRTQRKRRAQELDSGAPRPSAQAACIRPHRRWCQYQHTSEAASSHTGVVIFSRVVLVVASAAGVPTDPTDRTDPTDPADPADPADPTFVSPWTPWGGTVSVLGCIFSRVIS